jgi:hypothetical protein
MVRSLKILLIALVVVILTGTTYAFASAITLSPSNAGTGTSALPDYTVTSVEYTSDAVDATLLGSVTLVLDNPASDVKINLLGTTTPADYAKTTCAVDVDKVTVTCTPVAAIPILSMVSLDVIAFLNY